MILIPYKKGLASTGFLKERGMQVRYADTSTVRNRRVPTLALNWGGQKDIVWRGINNLKILNEPANLAQASNKALFYNNLRDVEGCPVPLSTTDKEEVGQWLRDEHIVLVRHSLASSGGEGIEVLRVGDNIPDAPLYVQYVRKQREYRIMYNAYSEEIVYWFIKRKQTGRELTSDEKLLRNTSSGYVYCRPSDIRPTVGVVNAVKNAAKFFKDEYNVGILAFDVGQDTETGRVTLYEANTAAGLCDRTARKLLHSLEGIDYDTV